MITKEPEVIGSPLQKSNLNRKGLCDYIINMEWGPQLTIRKRFLELLEASLIDKKTRRKTESGKGVVLLGSKTDPYQDHQIGLITSRAVKILLKHKKRIRVLTQNPLCVRDLDILSDIDITVGMNIPCLDDKLNPLALKKYGALQQLDKKLCRVFVVMAPTPLTMTLDNYRHTLEHLLKINPEVIFWEPENPYHPGIGKSYLGLTKLAMPKKAWLETFLHQWELLKDAAVSLGCLERIHPWPHRSLKGLGMEEWINKPSIERWSD